MAERGENRAKDLHQTRIEAENKSALIWAAFLAAALAFAAAVGFTVGNEDQSEYSPQISRTPN